MTKVVHWTQYNGSGMNAVAVTMAEAERKLGLDSIVLNSFADKDWSETFDADVHVSHTWFPETYNGKSLRRQFSKPFKLVWLGHGTPEHVFYETVIEAKYRGYGHGDPLMLYLYWLQHADARVTFWPRHKALLDTMVDKGTVVDCLPMGIDTAFWSGGKNLGREPGNPSVWSSENPHQIKWPLDLVLLWPLVYPHLDGAHLHLNYLVSDMHRQFAPLIARNGAGYGMRWSALTWKPDALRNILNGVDYFIGLVKYGDFNRLALEANCAGAKTISYRGNPYSDFWLPEGDQRDAAAELVRVLKGEVEPRKKDPVPDASETARAMRAIYERILDAPAEILVPGSLPTPLRVVA